MRCGYGPEDERATKSGNRALGARLRSLGVLVPGGVIRPRGHQMKSRVLVGCLQQAVEAQAAGWRPFSRLAPPCPASGGGGACGTLDQMDGGRDGREEATDFADFTDYGRT